MWFKKTAKKAENAIDKAAEDVDEVLSDAQKLMIKSEKRINLVTSLIVCSVALGITADIISIVVSSRSLKLFRK